MSTRVDTARIAVRKVMRDARDKNKWRKVVRFRLWMPVVLQLLLIVAVAWYTTTRFDNFINASNVTNILILAAPLAMAAMGQTHALLVGYLDLSVGAMVTFGVVVASFLIGPDASDSQIAIGVVAVFLCAIGLGLVNGALVVGVKIPSIVATLATLSILNGISLTLRETPGGIINREFTEALRADVGPIPVIFIVCVVVAGALDYWLHATGRGLQLRSTGFDDVSAKRNGVRTKWVRVRALVLSAVFAAVAAFFVETQTQFFAVAVLAGTGLGAIQAASRTLLASLAPPGSEARMFGFYALCGKSAAIMGPLVFGGVSYAAGGSQRLGILAVGCFFVIGIALLSRMRPPAPNTELVVNPASAGGS